MLQTESTQPAWQHCGDITLVSKNESVRVETKSTILLEAHVGMNVDNLKQEINDFFDYTNLLSTLKEYYNAYQQYFESQQEQTDSVRVEMLMDDLDRCKQQDRLLIMQSIAYIVLGSFCSGDALKHETKFIEAMVANSSAAHKAGVIERLFKHLFDYTRELPKDDEHHTLIDTCLTVLYISLITCDHGNPSLIDNDVPALLIKLTAESTPFPKKKLLLLLHKTLIVHLGQDAKSVKAHLRQLYGLPPVNNKGYSLKSRPKDMYDFYDEIKDKYTSYVSPQLDMAETNDPSDTTMDFPFHTLFQPNMPAPSTPKAAPTKGGELSTLEYKREIEKQQSSTPFALGTPNAIKEAGQLYASCMYVSISEHQITQAKLGQSTTVEHPVLNKIDQLYSAVVSDLPNLVNMLLQQLVIVAPVPQAPTLTDWNDTLNEHEHADSVRNREIIRSTVSSILLLLLKWFKTCHVMKFEYLSQLLVDSGYLMLSTRAFMIDDLKTIYHVRTDGESYSFFAQLPHMDFSVDGAFLSSACSTSSSLSLSYSWDPPTSPSIESVGTLINERNRSWVLETLNILQMLTKGKSVRSKLLAQYKAWIPLKRIAKNYKDSIEELYALKLLKNQVQFLGLAWRSDNMKTISSISRRCPIGLRDEWLSQCDDGPLKPEATMRWLVNAYHKQYQTDTHVDNTQLAKDINHLFKQPLKRLEKLQVAEPAAELDGWNAPSQIIYTNAPRKRNMNHDHSEDMDTDDEEECAGKEEEDPLSNIDWGTLTEDELEARLNLVDEQTVPRWMSSDINDTSDWKVLNALEDENPPVYDEEGWL
ncbi:hypothetical protein BJV82DRAFT_595200 [Fennellomyces sp. T-0311]|nr:hypothetical protein BJV82DRAFT_595200 [Fennellomyces sp. T-0311]